MASHRIKAVALCVAVAFAPLAAGQAFASGAPLLAVQDSTPPTSTEVAASITKAVADLKSSDAYKAMTDRQKAIAVQKAVSETLATSGATSEVMALAVNSVVGAGVVSATIAIQAASAVSTGLATEVASVPGGAVQQQMTAQGLTVTTASTAQIANGAPTVLVSMSSVSSTSTTNTGGGTGGTDTGNTNTVAPYDPCAGVIAAYCGI